MGKMDLEQLLKDNEARLNFYAPFKCFRESIPLQRREICENEIRELQARGCFFEANRIFFFVEELKWDSGFFGRKVFRLRYALAEGEFQYASVAEASRLFLRHLAEIQPAAEVWTAVPSEDVNYIQALNTSGFRLVVTRLRYFNTDLQQFDGPRSAVRLATAEDAPALRGISSNARNPSDRFHADACSTEAEADRFLGEYAAACAAGFADETLVPAKATLASFAAVNYEKVACLDKIGARLLVAAAGKENKGWFLKLAAECYHRGKDRGADFGLVVTQASNFAIIRSMEKLGASLRGADHILTIRLP